MRPSVSSDYATRNGWQSVARCILKSGLYWPGTESDGKRAASLRMLCGWAMITALPAAAEVVRGLASLPELVTCLMPSALPWDPEIDTPATIAIIGAGPGGIEAALYARFLGYSVELYDQHRVCDSLRRWGQRPMSGTWCDLTSPLGLAALQAHGHPLPEPGEVPTCLGT